MFAQDDFSCLDLAARQDAERQTIDDYEGFTSIERGGSVDSLKSEPACEAIKMHRPVNIIPDEVYELIRNWERAYRNQQESAHAAGSMETESSSTGAQASESVYEPMRCVSVSEPPPKRFFRTFWRSVTRRILQLNEKNVPVADIWSADATD